MSLVRIQDGQTTVIADNLTALDFTRKAGEQKITITMTVTRSGPRPGEDLSRTSVV